MYKSNEYKPQLEKNLTSTENNLIHLLRYGYNSQQIAETLDISIETVRTHIENIFYKMKVNSRFTFLQPLVECDYDISENLQITGRENDVLLGVLNGYTINEISENLNIAFGTTKKHRENILKKTRHALSLNSNYALDLDNLSSGQLYLIAEYNSREINNDNTVI